MHIMGFIVFFLVSGLSISNVALAQNTKAILSGTVTDSAQSEPVNNIRVVVLDSNNQVKGMATTDEAGHYEVEVVPDTYSVNVPYYAGGVGVTRQSLQLTDIEIWADKVLDIKVPPIYTISGQILQKDGKPISNAVISSSVLRGNGRIHPGENGEYALLFPPGEYTFFVVPAEETALPPHEIQLVVSDDVVIDIIIPPGFEVMGKVIGQDGAPMIGAQILYTAGRMVRYTSTHADGSYSLLLPGKIAEYQVSVSAPPTSVFYSKKLTLNIVGPMELDFNLGMEQDTDYFQEVTITRLPYETLGGLSMDANAADLDEDGDIDLVIAHEYRPNILLLNEGEGSFRNVSSERIPQVNRDSEDVGIADLDGDNDLDIIVVSEDDRVNELYLNDGLGFFTDAGDQLPVTGTSNAVQVADIDGDDDIDILIGNGGKGSPNVLLLNDGLGNFTDVTTQQMPVTHDITQDLELGDVDNDGDLDLLVGNEDANRLLINIGQGFFNESTPPLPLRVETEETREADFGDVDEDGDLDIYFANVVLFNQTLPTLSQNRLLLNDGTGSFTDETAQRLPPDMDNSFDADFFDIDRDGDLDVVTANAFPTSLYRAYANRGEGVFEEATLQYFPAGMSGNGFDIEAEDFNGDGLPDLYFSSQRGVDRLLFGRRKATVIEEEEASIPMHSSLEQNYPNPFNGSTIIPYTLVELSHVELSIFNISGQQIKRLVNEVQPAGKYHAIWNGLNDVGQPIGSGVIFYYLSTGSQVSIRRMVLIR